ncbi:MAG: hypothetical protein ACM30G_04420 [Micromonosporaceae bacterium]
MSFPNALPPDEARQRWHTEARERDEAYLELGPIDYTETRAVDQAPVFFATDLPDIFVGAVWVGSVVKGWEWRCGRSLAPRCRPGTLHATEEEALQRAADHWNLHEQNDRLGPAPESE